MAQRKKRGAPITSNAQTAFARLKCWAGRRGYEVQHVAQTSVVIRGLGLIGIDSRAGPQAQVLQMLHECGHILQGPNYSTRTPRPPQSSDACRFRQVAEEYDAWVRGRKLADRLGIAINDTSYWRQAAICLYTYGDWALDAREVRRRKRAGSKTKRAAKKEK